MEPVTVDKEILLARMRENLGRHRQVFLDALDGYRAYAIEILEKQVKDLRNGKTPEIRITVSRPQDHSKDYERVIQMLEMHKDSEYTLGEGDFARYVRDDWEWKRQWLKMSSRYAAASTISNYGSDALEDDDY